MTYVVIVFMCSKYFRDIKRLYTGFWEWFCSREDFFSPSLTALVGGCGTARANS